MLLWNEISNEMSQDRDVNHPAHTRQQNVLLISFPSRSAKRSWPDDKFRATFSVQTLPVSHKLRRNLEPAADRKMLACRTTLAHALWDTSITFAYQYKSDEKISKEIFY